MATYYVGIGGNDANDGTSWSSRKLTLNGAEDIPVAAGDTVYVGPGTYREMLTCDVSGSDGSPITYIGDYDGSHTDGVGGIVRISGSDDDSSMSTRMHLISASSKNYRTFKSFVISDIPYKAILVDNSTDWTLENLYFTNSTNSGAEIIKTDNATTNLKIKNCYFTNINGYVIYLYDNVDQSDTNIVIENCLFNCLGNVVIRSDNIGGVLIRNCTFIGWAGGGAIRVAASLASGQTITVNNCIFANGQGAAVWATVTGEIIEDYNNFFTPTARTNVSAGAHSTSKIVNFDTRWFFEMVGGGSMLTPFDLASYSKLINVEGISPTATDMRGTAKIGAEREWGALEYDSTLDIEAGSGGGGSVKILPLGRIGL